MAKKLLLIMVMCIGLVMTGCSLEQSNDNSDDTAKKALKFVSAYGTNEEKVWLDGTYVEKAEAQVKDDVVTGGEYYCILIKFNEEGTKIFAEATTELYNHGNDILYVVYNDKAISKPSVKAPITNGEAEISGFETYDAAEELASLLSN